MAGGNAERFFGGLQTPGCNAELLHTVAVGGGRRAETSALDQAATTERRDKAKRHVCRPC